MFLIIFIGFILFSSPLQAQVPHEQALDTLLDTPWAKSPADLPDYKSWTIEPYSILNTGELQGYYLRTFGHDRDSLQLKLFTYSEPSLSSFSEVILMGYVQGVSQTQEEAKPLQDKMTTYMKSRGFVDSPADSITKQLVTWRAIDSCISLKKGDINCLIYNRRDIFNKHRDDRNNRLLTRTMVFPTRFQEFRTFHIAEWPKWWNSDHIMPKKLIRELENKNISRIILPAQWKIIKSISATSPKHSLRKSHTISVSELISTYETLDKTIIPENDQPAFLLLKNYLARYLFICGLVEEMTPEQREWLTNHGLKYTWSELGGSFNYGETVLLKLIDEFPDDYWGQFAFLELLRRGFDTSGMCRGGQDQWTKVLKEGASFLDKYPDSEFTPDIRFYMGQAAETLFNLGTMKDNAFLETSGLSWKQYSDKSENARKQAIDYYEKVLQSPQKGVYENYLKYILPRLREGFATGNAYYFCFYD